MFDKAKLIPASLKPKFVSKILLALFDAAVARMLTLMPNLRNTEDPFIRSLALACV